MTRKLIKSKFTPGDTVYARTHRFPSKSFIIKLIKYNANYEWYADYIDTDTGEIRYDYFDERDFD